MMGSVTSSHPTPERIFQMMTAYVQTGALKGAIDLGLFTAIAEGANTVPMLMERLGVPERGIRILADYLTVAGLMSKQDGVYNLSPDAAMFLDRNQRSYLGGASGFLTHPEMISFSTDVEGVVRRGTRVGGREMLEIENHIWVEFAKGMMPMMMPAAQYMADLAGFGETQARVLDIAAGHGIFGIMTLLKNPGVTVDALDWPSVLEVAASHAAQFGVSDRWNATPGSALEMEFGPEYDLMYLTNFLHHFSFEENVSVLRRCRAALKPEGRVFTLEFIPNPDRVTPAMQAAFSMTMLLNTPQGDAYTFAELDAMFREAGFLSSELHDVPHSPQRLVISR
jgi:2-polyprenyl-3-methyl-5-hydroxy-6-metoxy-1,4-benzoquinol methylase